MKKIRVLVVDDSVVIRKLLKTVIDANPDMEVLATAANGSIAIQKIERFVPDIITMDLDMPEVDGLEAVKRIRRQGNDMPIIMVSAMTTVGAQMTLDTLEAGADDFITKPGKLNDFNDCINQLNQSLIPKIRALVPRDEINAFIEYIGEAEPTTVSKSSQFDALLIGCSTGGPVALNQLFSHLDITFKVPIFIVQHMPPFFTKNLANRLDETFDIPFKECGNFEKSKAGTAYLAQGGKHMQLERHEDGVYIVTNEKPMVHYCRPAVDLLFESAVKVFGGNLVAVVMTGMGQDGSLAAELIHQQGGKIIVQDEESSVVWGMPGAIVKRGYADEILPIESIAMKIKQYFG